MRRKAGIAVTACAALTLAGLAGTTAWQYAGDDDRRPIGTWHEPDDARTPVAAEQQVNGRPKAPAGSPSAPAAAPPELAPRTEAQQPSATPPAPGSERVHESATATATGRQKVGELLRVDKLLGYLNGAPQRETFAYP